MDKNKLLLVLLLFIMLGLIGCQYIPSQEGFKSEDRNVVYGELDSEADTNTRINATEESYTKERIEFHEGPTESKEPTELTESEKSKGSTTSSVEDNTIEHVEKETEEGIREATETNPLTSLDFASIPDFNGEPFCVLNNNTPFFNNSDKSNTTVFEYYSDLDRLGRCGVAYASICKELMPTEKRGEIGQIRPSGWHTVKYNDIIDGNYLYNRCHLIGYQLAGENANEKNLITGTRYMNVVGMMAFESEVYEYVQETNNHVLYRVTPLFEGNNLVASGVEMEAYSVEDNGTGVCFNVYMYNVQPGIVIDYATGDSSIDPEYCAEHTTDNKELERSKESLIESTSEIPACDYVLNKNTKKFHYSSCGSVQDMKEKNKEYYTGDRQTLIEQGYSPCGRCKP